jgi:hypothetical protein
MPELIFWLLVGIVLMSALLAGQAMARRPRRRWLHMVCFSAIIVVIVTVIFRFQLSARRIDPDRFG